LQIISLPIIEEIIDLVQPFFLDQFDDQEISPDLSTAILKM